MIRGNYGVGNIGAFNRSIYDVGQYQKDLYESTSPFAYLTTFSKYENCNKCRVDRFYNKFDSAIIDVDSELKNIFKPLSKLDQYQYGASCIKDGHCIGTNANRVPRVAAADLCPIVFNNIRRTTNPGFRSVDMNICGGRRFF